MTSPELTGNYKDVGRRFRPFTVFADQRSAIVERADAVGNPVEFVPDTPQLPPTFSFGCLIFSVQTASIPLRFPI